MCERAHAAGDMHLKQFRRRAKRRTRTNRHGHELLVRREVVHLTAISPPARLVPTRRRNGPLPVSQGKGLNMDFKAAGLVRAVRHQQAIRRKVAVQLIAGRRQKNHRLRVPRERHQPQVVV